MFWNNRFSVIADKWVPMADGRIGEVNIGQSEVGTIKQEWYVPADCPRQSGKNYVELDDGRVFMRYDCYASNSPYGWNQVDRKTIEVPRMSEDDIHVYVRAMTDNTNHAFSWLSTKEVCQKWQAHFASISF